jgi:hypothetical protein
VNFGGVQRKSNQAAGYYGALLPPFVSSVVTDDLVFGQTKDQVVTDSHTLFFFLF